jgi:broad specificity phosphatase PhoE
MSRALLLRHGESAHNAHTGSEALADAEGDRLTELGREQARAAGAGLAGRGVTRLLSSPMRRATETAEIVGAALGLEPEPLTCAHELSADESFEEVLGRVAALKATLEGGPSGLPLVVSHGIFIRFFLLDSVLGPDFTAPIAGRIWQLASINCGLSVFARGEYRDPSGALVPGWTCHGWMQDLGRPERPLDI